MNGSKFVGSWLPLYHDKMEMKEQKKNLKTGLIKNIKLILVPLVYSNIYIQREHTKNYKTTLVQLAET